MRQLLAADRNDQRVVLDLLDFTEAGEIVGDLLRLNAAPDCALDDLDGGYTVMIGKSA